MAAGASAIQVGTANYYDPKISQKLVEQLPAALAELGVVNSVSRSCRYYCESQVEVMRVLSGIQPTGRFHWGNYFGAIRQYIELQDEHEGYYFIANLHALTTVRDAELLRSLTRDAAMDLLALGLNPAESNFVCSIRHSRSVATDLDTDDWHAAWIA